MYISYIYWHVYIVTSYVVDLYIFILWVGIYYYYSLLYCITTPLGFLLLRFLFIPFLMLDIYPDIFFIYTLYICNCRYTHITNLHIHCTAKNHQYGNCLFAEQKEQRKNEYSNLKIHNLPMDGNGVCRYFSTNKSSYFH